MTSRFFRISLLTIFAVAAAGTCCGIVWTRNEGAWPKDWPAELEPLRAGARTIEVGTGIQERQFEITFATNEEFVKIWPALLKVRTPGSPLKLQRISQAPPGSWGSIASNALPKVRIYGPPGGTAGVPAVAPGKQKPSDTPVKMLRISSGPPWPVELISAKGELPEYVQAAPRDGKATWVAAEVGKGRPGFYTRARIDIELVVDGSIIDLNCIQLPSDARIIDERFVAEPASSAK